MPNEVKSTDLPEIHSSQMVLNNLPHGSRRLRMLQYELQLGRGPHLFARRIWLVALLLAFRIVQRFHTLHKRVHGVAFRSR